MKILTLTVVLAMIAATVQYGVAFAQTEPDGKAPEIPPDLLPTLQNDLKDAQWCGPDCSECLEGRSLKENVRAIWLFNLPQQAMLVEGIGTCLAGNANGEKLLYARAGNGWRKILEAIGQSLDVCAEAVKPCHELLSGKGSDYISSESERKSTRTRGWPDLTLWMHGSATSGRELVYQFDGNLYKAIACKDVDYGDPVTGAKPYSTACEWGWKASR